MSDLTLALSALTGGAAGALDKIDGAGLSDGDAAVVVLSTGVYHYHLNATSGATENSPYVISPDTNAGTKRWILVAPVAPLSHVFVNTDAGQSIPNAVATLVLFEDEVTDPLSEYNTGTGLFTAKSTGIYLFSIGLTFDIATFGSTEQIIPYAYKNGGIYAIGPKSYGSGAAKNMAISFTTTVALAAADTLAGWVYQNEGDAVALRSSSAVWNWMSIDRII